MTRSMLRGLAASLLLTASGLAGAADFCPMPYLYATNIRSACEQYGVGGLATLYTSSRFIHDLTHAPARVPVASR